MPESTCLIDKMRAHATASDHSSPTSYVAGLRDAEGFFRGLEAMPVALAQIKYENRQRYLSTMNRKKEHHPAKSRPAGREKLPRIV